MRRVRLSCPGTISTLSHDHAESNLRLYSFLISTAWPTLQFLEIGGNPRDGLPLLFRITQD